jgi:hypothetical protein
MEVDYINSKGNAVKADFFRIGNMLAITVGPTTHRIALTRGQWNILMDSAKNAVAEMRDDRPHMVQPKEVTR